MNWQRTWKDTVESFLRGLHGADGVEGSAERGRAEPDLLMDAVAAARGEAAAVETELRATESALASEEAGVADCVRRAELADRIGDTETVRIARRFEERHQRRVDLLRRKRAVLADERALCQRELDELIELLRRADPASEPVSAATSEAPGRSDRDARRSAVDAAFRDLEDEIRERNAGERLDELKRRGG